MTLPKPNRLNLGNISEVGARHTQCYSHREPQFRNEFASAVEDYSRRDNSPHSRIRFRSRELSSWQDSYPSTAVAQWPLNKELAPRQDQPSPDSPVIRNCSSIPPFKRSRSDSRRPSESLEFHQPLQDSRRQQPKTEQSAHVRSADERRPPETVPQPAGPRASDPSIQTRRAWLMASRHVASVTPLPKQAPIVGNTTPRPSLQPLAPSPTDKTSEPSIMLLTESSVKGNARLVEEGAETVDYDALPVNSVPLSLVASSINALEKMLSPEDSSPESASGSRGPIQASMAASPGPMIRPCLCPSLLHIPSHNPLSLPSPTLRPRLAFQSQWYLLPRGKQRQRGKRKNRSITALHRRTLHHRHPFHAETAPLRRYFRRPTLHLSPSL